MLKIACCQMKCCTKKEDTLAKVEKLISQAKQNSADVLILPEMFICPYEYDKFSVYAETENENTVQTLSSLAKKYQINIFAGTIPEKVDNKLFNTAFVFNSSGDIIAKYRKKHLFDIDIKGKITFKESDYFCAGEQNTTVEIGGVVFGIAICFDVRFPCEFDVMRKNGAEVFVLPASFNMTTGPVHWELLLRSRALDNQCYMVACAGALEENSSYHSYGHSMFVSPWGEVLQVANQEECILYETIDTNFIKQVRKQIPLI